MPAAAAQRLMRRADQTVEVDGSQHFESSQDKERDAALARQGFRVLRYWNNDVLQRPESVLEDILSNFAV